MAGQYTLSIKVGETLRKNFTVKSNGLPVNLTGASPLMALLPNGSSQIACNPANGKLVVSDAIGGKLSLHLTAIETATYTWKRGKHYLSITFPNSDVKAYIEGPIILSPLGG